MHRCMTTSTNANQVGTILQILAARAANNVVKFKSAPSPVSRPMTHSTTLVHHHVIILRQTFRHTLSHQHTQL